MSDEKGSCSELERSNAHLVPENNQEWRSKLGMRHIQILLLFFCITFNYMIRINLSVAVVAMTDSNSTTYQTFDWSPAQKSTLLSAFFWGYLPSNFVAAAIVNRVDNKLLLLVTCLLSALSNVLTPSIVDSLGYWSILVIRIGQGMMQGFMMPIVHAQLSRWAPPLERARLGTLVLGGCHMGTILSYIVSGELANTSQGWPSIFYLTGALILIWAFVWHEVGATSPSTAKYMSDNERNYIESTLVHTSLRRVRPPWRAILSNKACYAVALATLGHNWGYWTLITEIPSYFQSVLQLNISSNGLVSAMPYLALWLVSFPASYIADTLIRKEITSITASRKIWNSMAHWGAAIGLIVLGHMTDTTAIIIVYTITVSLTGFTFMGYNINHLDLTPNFAGLLMGLTNGIANISSILGPLFVGVIVDDMTSQEEWRTVFYISAGVFALGNSLFLLLGSGEVQPFNYLAETNNTSSTEEGTRRRHVSQNSEKQCR